MNKQIIYSLIGLLGIFGCLFGQSTINHQLLSYKELQINYKDIGFFKSISDVAGDGDILYLVDNSMGSILRFKITNETMVFDSFFGNIGQGPGELQLPITLSIWNHNVAVRDQVGISIFDRSGRFINRFRIFSHGISICFSHNLVYCTSFNPVKEDILEAYSLQGKRLFTFFKKTIANDALIRATSNMTADFILNDGLLTADGNCLLFINKRFGTINKFDFSGNIINEINPFNNLDDNSSRIIKKNQDLFIKGSFISRSSRMIIPEYFVCRDAACWKNRLFILKDQYNMADKTLNKCCEIVVFDVETLRILKIINIPFNSEERCLNLSILGEENPRILLAIDKNGEFSFYLSESIIL